jgi:hypothetical protein
MVHEWSGGFLACLRGLAEHLSPGGALFSQDRSVISAQSPAEQQCGQDRYHGNADDRWHVILF